MPSTGQRSITLDYQLSKLCWVFAAAVMCSGCAMVPDAKRKPQYYNPFPQLQKIAVLPFLNQSEEATLSGERVAQAYANEIQAIRGFDVLPLGAVKAKMAQYRGELTSGEQFQAFAQYLGVDAVLVGSITDYDAYYPPRMTLAVHWYAANAGYHPILPGYGLPWGTKAEDDIPRWVHQESQRALATEQLKTQTPVAEAIMPEDRPTVEELPPQPAVTAAAALEIVDDQVVSEGYPGEMEFIDPGDSLPGNWPDPRGFVPDSPGQQPPKMQSQHNAIIEHMRSFNGSDEDFTEQLEEYFYFRDDARFGGWQSYLQRSEDFIRFCCYLHLTETLTLRGGQEESRLILRWPIDRYSR